MNLDQVVDNRTPMSFSATAVIDRHGYEVLLVIAKMTWSVTPAGVVTIASPQSPVRFSDVPTSDGLGASIRYPSDVYEEKAGTDVLLVGTAQPPPGRRLTEMDVGLRIETGQRTIQKFVKVYGPRVFQKTMLSVAPGPPAELLRPTPLVYENTYGGTDVTEPQRPVADPRNPIGRGFAKNRATLVGQAAPQIEDPRASLTSKNPAPAGFGAVNGGWAPRLSFAGTYDDVWRKKRAPLRPADFDPRFYSSAPPDLWSDVPLQGDEPVEIVGTTPAPIWRFRLPRYAPVFNVSIRGEWEVRPTHLDTYLIDADEGRVEVTHRAVAAMPRKLEQIDKVVIMGAPNLSEALIEELAERVRARRSHAA